MSRAALRFSELEAEVRKELGKSTIVEESATVVPHSITNPRLSAPVLPHSSPGAIVFGQGQWKDKPVVCFLFPLAFWGIFILQYSSGCMLTRTM